LSIFTLGLFSCASSSEETIKDNDFQVQLQSYKPKNLKQDKKILLILPPTGGMNFIDKSYARRFARAGIKTKILKNWTNDNEQNIELSIHTRFYKRAQRAIDLVLEKYPDHDFWLLGTSVGGLHGSITTARQPQVKKALFIVAGADIASILVNSTQEALQTLKKLRFEKYKYINDEEYLQALRAVMPYEVQKLDIPKGKLLGLIISENDKVVPTKNQLLLEQLWNAKRVSTPNHGHTPSVVYTWLFNSNKVKNFFLK